MADIVADSGGGSSSSSVPLSESTASGSVRRERGVIAAQACDNCRVRKQRCDERRPRCGTCIRFKLECQYREPQPTKKDKTLSEILERLKTLESKIDGLGASTALGTPANTAGVTTATTLPSIPLIDPSLPSQLGDVTQSSQSFQDQLWSPDPPPRPSNAGSHNLYRYSPALYQILCWPAVQLLLRPLAHRLPGIASLPTEHDALRLVLGLHQPRSQLPQDTNVLPGSDERAAAAQPASPTGLPGPTVSAGSPPAPPLTWDSVFSLSQAYFDVFNCVFPILDRHTFQTRTLTAAFGGVHDDHRHHSSNTLDDSTTLTFLVAALGEAALAGLHGTPEPPAGLALFNEARKRMGFTLSKCSLETVQIYALAGIYCGTCFHHMESWRFATAASLACQALITSKPSELASAHIDLIRRNFWYCLIVETHFHIELGLPLTGLDKYEALVGLPDFGGPYSHEDYLANQASHFQEYFASQIVLRRLFIVFHNTLSTGPHTPSSVTASAPLTSLPPIALPPPPPPPTFSFPDTVNQIARQLDGWRGMLTPDLCWSETGPPVFPPGPGAGGGSGRHSKAPGLGRSPHTQEPLFFVRSVQAALLCTRYYSIKCMIYRPFFYKALHGHGPGLRDPGRLPPDDAAGAAAYLSACLHWPEALAPIRTHKQLVPCQFVATQTMLGILLLLRLAQQLPALPQILEILYSGGGAQGTLDPPPPGSASGRHGSGGDNNQQRFERDSHKAAALCIDWIRDQRDIDRAAEWAWEIANGVYHLDE